ncbi:hypothetical protein ABK040_015194 [Willaertia magna]
MKRLANTTLFGLKNAFYTLSSVNHHHANKIGMIMNNGMKLSSCLNSATMSKCFHYNLIVEATKKDKEVKRTNNKQTKEEEDEENDMVMEEDEEFEDDDYDDEGGRRKKSLLFKELLEEEEVKEKEPETEEEYLERLAKDLGIHWNHYFRNLSKRKELRDHSHVLVTSDEELGIDHITKLINREIPPEFTTYRLIRISDGAMLGDKVPRAQAEEIAKQEGLDLILVVANVSPPVVKLGDYNTYLKHLIIKDKVSGLKDLEKEVEEKKTKEIKFSGSIDGNDLKTKTAKLANLLTRGKKVKVICYRFQDDEKGMNLVESFVEKAKQLVQQSIDVDLKKALEEEKPTKQKTEIVTVLRLKPEFLGKKTKGKDEK